MRLCTFKKGIVDYSSRILNGKVSFKFEFCVSIIHVTALLKSS